jgi:hypothetical protein
VELSDHLDLADDVVIELVKVFCRNPVFCCACLTMYFITQRTILFAASICAPASQPV